MKCPTHILDDTPPPKDQFALQGEGPHERVARAMADLIQSSEHGGILIGLEGGWGSGKTTVISLMRTRLDSVSATTLFAFDAWAHERDPLRRSFLESLVRHFQKVQWVEGEHWNNVLETLSNRRRVTKTRTIPHTTTFGKLLIFSALLVPLGTALVAGSLQRGVTFAASRPINWGLVIGLALSVAPLLVVVGQFVRRFVRTTRMPTKTTAHRDFRQNTEKKDTDALSEWALLTGNAISETQQDTTELPEPTSIEFEDEFRRLMTAAMLGSESRKAVLVLDNLDRVGPEDAFSIWSTLQTFLQDRSTKVEEWFKKIWVIVPYDKSGLRRLWIARRADSAENDSNDLDGIAESFIDKSFQIRFEVPPPVLSNWKRYLSQLVNDALPQHAKDAHTLYRIFNHCIAKQTRPPTPRELKLYVNQIGALHRQWEHHFPMDHLAYYAALKRGNKTGENIREGLLSGDVPDRSLAALLTPNLRTNLTGLLFNVEASVGEQLLLSDPILRSLANNDGLTLARLEQVHQDGFWVVLEDVVGSRIGEEGAAVICSAAQSLNSSDLLRDRSKQDVQATISAFAETARDVTSWSPLTKQTVSGIAAACSIVNNTEFSATVLNSVRSTLKEVAGESTEPQLRTDALIMQLTGLASEIRELGHDQALSTPFTLPGTADEWVTNCVEIAKRDDWVWALFQPSVQVAEIASFLSAEIVAGNISEDALFAIKVTNSNEAEDSWNDLVTALEQRLDAGQGASTAEGTLLLHALALLRRYQSSEAQTATRRLSDPGHLLHLLYQSQQENHLACRAWCLIAFLQEQPDAKKPREAGNSEAGHAELMRILSEDDPELAEEVVGILTDLDEVRILLSIVDARDDCEPFLISCLRQVADSKNPLRLYSPAETIDRWRILDEHLWEEAAPSRFSDVIQKLCADTDLVAKLQQRGFRSDDSGLYIEVLRAQPGQDFVAFCRAGLEPLNSEVWTSELQEEGATLDLLIELQEGGVGVSLTWPYQDALVNYANTLLSGSREPSQQLIAKRGVVFSPLSQSSRNLLRDRLRDAVIEKGVQSADGFFQMFGDEISEPSLLKDRNDIVAKLFSAVVRERVVSGVAWLHRILERDPTLLEASPDNDAVSDFKERVQGEISRESEEGDQVGESINRIADVLGIRPRPTIPPREEEPDSADGKEDPASDA